VEAGSVDGLIGRWRCKLCSSIAVGCTDDATQPSVYVEPTSEESQRAPSRMPTLGGRSAPATASAASRRKRTAATRPVCAFRRRRRPRAACRRPRTTVCIARCRALGWSTSTYTRAALHVTSERALRAAGPDAARHRTCCYDCLQSHLIED